VPPLVVQTDTPDYCYVNFARQAPNGHALFFGAVRRGKAYVSFHLMPVYCSPEL
jgi:hypothetical protein